MSQVPHDSDIETGTRYRGLGVYQRAYDMHCIAIETNGMVSPFRLPKSNPSSRNQRFASQTTFELRRAWINRCDDGDQNVTLYRR
jgi:hypothetical protein